MSQELWATYSVKDHLGPRALAADILFDRLVFPVPENACFPEGSGSPDTLGPVQWTRNEPEWARWKSEGWDPDGQFQLLKSLEPVVRKVPWNEQRNAQLRAEAAKLTVQELPEYAFIATRTVLTRDLPAHVTGVAAVGPSFRTVTDMERQLGIRGATSHRPLPGGALATVLGWEFLIPENDRLSDEA